ncbi:ABC transporter ATP-binding protein [Ruegeria sp. EL01]|jgi:lactose/L-arabinose transport system ATP-binding protein|uniref:ABC transporter ATP-binding protein n=1 Tax=Ruegeria sp. EL01 TaxID=2107578 RepID=UPI000EA80116|nr:ABC transporter ATP-binding protein [Ruegeria sp. EL01]
MANLELIGVEKNYAGTRVIHGIDLEVEHGEFVVFVGPSGCGKSTALRMICGLETLSKGDIRIGGKSMRNISPSKRGTAMVFQSYALYPHMSVAENMAFSMRMEGIPKAERRKKVAEVARILQLDELLDRKPKELSGGQRQRVAIGRAIVRKPEVFLFDEPLSNLDAELRVQMRMELARLHKEIDATMIYVTHDQVEAMTLADKIVVLRAGRIEQVGTPLELYENPCNVFVAGFIGTPSMNFLDGVLDGGKVRIPALGNLEIPAEINSKSSGDVVVGFRPHHVSVTEDTQASLSLDLTEQLGGVTYSHLVAATGERIIVETRENTVGTPGGNVAIAIELGKAMFFDPVSQERLR